MRSPSAESIACVALVAALLLGGCGDEDGETVRPNESLVLVLSDEFEPMHHRLAAAAADGWNVEVGTRIRVGEPVAGDRIVTVALSDPDCRFDNGDPYVGYTSDLREGAIFVCPDEATLTASTFLVLMQHELGHVLGLEHIEDEPSAVMYAPEDPDTAVLSITGFTSADRAEFARVNPGFVEATPCGINRTLAEGDGAASFVRGDPNHRVVILRDQALELLALDPESARPAGAATPLGLETERAFDLDATTTTGGDFAMTWNDRQLVGVARVRPTGEVISNDEVEVDDDDFVIDAVVDEDGRTIVAVARFGALETHLFDAAEGVETSTKVEGIGVLAALPNGPVFVGLRRTAPDAGVLFAAYLGEDLAPTARVDLAEVPFPEDDSRVLLPIAGPLGDGLFATSIVNDATILVRADADLTPIAAQRPSESFGPAPVVVERDGELAIIATAYDEDFVSSEVMVAAFDATTLERLRPWRRIGAPDAFPSFGDGLIEDGDGLVALFTEGLGAVRSRCLAWP